MPSPDLDPLNRVQVQIELFREGKHHCPLVWHHQISIPSIFRIQIICELECKPQQSAISVIPPHREGEDYLLHQQRKNQSIRYKDQHAQTDEELN